MSSLPFVISGVPAILIDLEGIARIEGAELILEFRARFVLHKAIKSRTTREVRIPLAELEEITFRRRLFSGVVKLRARRLEAFGSMPGVRGSELRLKCKRAHWPLAQELVSRLNMRVTERELRELVDSVPPATDVHEQNGKTSSRQLSQAQEPPP